MSRRRRRSFSRRAGGARASTLARLQPEPVSRVRLGAPGDLVAIVPYLLGFVPTESVVAVLVGGGRVRLTARVDLPEELPDASQVDPWAGWATELFEAQRPDSVVLLTYTTRGEPARTWAAHLTERLQPYGVTESLVVDGTRWWSLVCTAGCCPAEGTPYDLSTHPVAAAAVYAGLSALPDRASLATWVAGPPDESIDGLTEVVTQARSALPRSRGERQRAMAALVEEYLTEPRTLSELDCCRLAVLAEDVHVRDVAWAMIEPDRAEDHVALWRQVVAHAVPPLESAPVCLLGMAGWISGNGALINFCLDRMADLDPDYTMATILEDIVARALPPSRWEGIRGEDGIRGVMAG